jgi:5,10-methylene-tetrahydrofolate dehydrogenase/methenyl tetrahydrofolate cyclohydrolase
LIEEEEVGSDIEDSQVKKAPKKVVHFGEAEGHIELKDLKEKDFLDLIDSKNQDRRFYGWLHFYPHNEHLSNPYDDIEYFR